MATENKLHIPALDGIRAVSILSVLAGHMLPLGPSQLQLNQGMALTGMSLFFVLSGFLITSFLLKNQNVLEFFIKRILRIFPLAAVFSIFVYVLLVPNAHALIAHLLFFSNYDPAARLTKYAAHYWSLCVEMQFYVVVGLIVLAFGRSGLYLLPFLCVVVTALRIFEGAEVAIVTHLRVDEILAGACLALFHNLDGRYTDRAKAWIARGIWIFPLILFASSHPWFGPFQYFRAYAAALTVGSAMYTNNASITTFLSSKPMAYIAKVSYALYLIHGPTRFGWLGEGTKFELYLIKRPISFLLTFTLAHFSTFYWEKYWNDQGRRLIAYLRLRRAPAE